MVNAESIQILLVEDYLVVQHMYTKFLKKDSGLKVDAVTTIAEAQAKTEQHEYDLILSDLTLPDASGLDFLRSYRESHPKGSGAKFVIFSDRDDPDTLQRAHDAGCDDYWVKVDTTPHALADKIKHLFQSAN